MTRICSVTLGDTNVHTLASVLPEVPAGQFALTKGSFFAIRCSDLNGSAVTVNVGTLGYATDGYVAVAKGDPSFVMQTSGPIISLSDFVVKASATGVIFELIVAG